jgi:SAM-dependent methyltransferase
MARAGLRVTALDSSADMLALLGARLSDEGAGARVEPVQADIRRFQFDRLFRFACMPFNTLLMFSQPHERHQVLDRVREHLAPSGAFAFDVFTPDPKLLRPSATWELDLEHDAEDPGGEGLVHIRRDIWRDIDYGSQTMRSRFRHRVSRGGVTLVAWEDELQVSYIFPRELDLLLERQGFRVQARYGGPDKRPYKPSPEDIQPQFVVAQLIP